MGLAHPTRATSNLFACIVSCLSLALPCRIESYWELGLKLRERSLLTSVVTEILDWHMPGLQKAGSGIPPSRQLSPPCCIKLPPSDGRHLFVVLGITTQSTTHGWTRKLRSAVLSLSDTITSSLVTDPARKNILEVTGSLILCC